MKATISFSKKCALSVCFLSVQLFSASAFAGEREKLSFDNFGVRVGATVSGNRFGIMYNPSVSYTAGNHTFSGGLTFQKQKNALSGGQVNYEFMLMDGTKHYASKISHLELFTFATATYYHHAFLNEAACAEERSANIEQPREMGNVQLKAMDVYAGFGMRVIFLKNFRWSNSIGIGGYNVFNAPEGLYYNSRSLGLMMNTGISYQFSNRNAKINL